MRKRTAWQDLPSKFRFGKFHYRNVGTTCRRNLLNMPANSTLVQSGVWSKSGKGCFETGREWEEYMQSEIK